MNTRRIPGRDKIGSLTPGKYTEFSGTEIVAENCVKAKVKDLRVEGKTYQNLLKPINSTNWSGEGCEITDNYIKLIQSGYTEDIRTSCDLLKSGTKYTLVYNVKNHTLSSKAFVLKGGMEEKFIVNNNITLPIAIGLNRFTFTTSSTKANVSLFSLGISSGSLDGEYIELSDIILLEGDYTNTDLPTSITGIESVAEKENNILALKVNDVVSNISLPIPLRSLPNGICDTIEGNKLIQKVGKIVLDGTQTMLLSNVNQTETTRVKIFMPNAKVSNNNLVCNWYIRTSVHGDYEYIYIQDSSTGICLFISVLNSKLATVDLSGITEYFKGNPLPVYYELETPIVHDLTIPQLATVKGTNIITCNNNIKPNMTMKLKIK